MTDTLQHITLHESNEGSTWVTVLEAKSRRALTKAVRTRNWSNATTGGADCTGRVFMGTCRMLHAYIEGDTWYGVVLYTEARDV